ncbi:MAG TPA: ABC transporter ATP-binding protein [Candidatus Limnocylindria bacterium]
MIDVRELRRAFGGIHALAGVDLRVEAGERRAVIGPNGAGKTTFFNVLTGEIRATGGTMRLNGAELGPLSTWRRARLGLARMYQRNELFDPLSARDNVLLAISSLGGAYRPFRSPVPAEVAQADAVLEQVGLADRRSAAAGALSHGERRQLELALALARKPRVLLLDEPTAGMSPAETERITALISGLDRSMTLLIVEHDMDVVFRLADRITVLHEGRAIAEGTPDQIRGDRQVNDVYLGKQVEA